MRRCALVTALLMLAVALPSPVAAQQTAVDSAVAATAHAARRTVYERAQRLVNDGNGAEGRALLDSLLEATEPRSDAEAEVLLRRATLAESWDAAQRDYLRVMLEHERSPYAAQARLRLAQGEATRGDRDAALRYLERLSAETPDSPLRPEATLWQGRILLDRGARADGCALLRDGRTTVDAGALELVNQYDYLLRSCARLAAADTARTSTPSPAERQAPAPTPAPASTPPPASGQPAPRGGLVWSVQIGAFPDAATANGFAADMRARGYEARVDGTAAPFRVRVGRFASRADAEAAMQAYRSKERRDAFLTQVPRP